MPCYLEIQKVRNSGEFENKKVFCFVKETSLNWSCVLSASCLPKLGPSAMPRSRLFWVHNIKYGDSLCIFVCIRSFSKAQTHPLPVPTYAGFDFSLRQLKPMQHLPATCNGYWYPELTERKATRLNCESCKGHHLSRKTYNRFLSLHSLHVSWLLGALTVATSLFL